MNKAIIGEFAYFDRKPGTEDVFEEVLKGLLAETKRIAPKYFYDQKGSELFDAITNLPEYYLTRTELSIFDRYGEEMGEALGSNVCLVEYGSGSSLKIRKLLEGARPLAYVPVDISGDHLRETAAGLHADYPWLNVYPTCADFTRTIDLPAPVSKLDKVGFFPGSSIGNFSPEQAVEFLISARQTISSDGRFIIGVDGKKSAEILNAAYNDEAGITAAFNLNLLDHLNQLLDADFDRNLFRHRAAYNQALGCVQMFLDVLADHEVILGGQRVEFSAGESVHTENSYKYEPDEFLEIAALGGFENVETWSDQKNWFSIFLLEIA